MKSYNPSTIKLNTVNINFPKTALVFHNISAWQKYENDWSKRWCTCTRMSISKMVQSTRRGSCKTGMEFRRLSAASTSGSLLIFYISQHFVHRSGLDKVFFFVPSLLRDTRLEATKSTPERKHKDATLEFLISDWMWKPVITHCSHERNIQLIPSENIWKTKLIINLKGVHSAS